MSDEHGPRPPTDDLDEISFETLEPPLPAWLRIVLFVVGAALFAVGLVALALPVVPQAIPLISGAALMSLASDRLYLFLRTRLRGLPWVWKPFRAFRRRVHRLLSGRGERDD